MAASAWLRSSPSARPLSQGQALAKPTIVAERGKLAWPGLPDKRPSPSRRSSLVGDRFGDLRAHRAERAAERRGAGGIVASLGRLGDRRAAALQEPLAAPAVH